MGVKRMWTVCREGVSPEDGSAAAFAASLLPSGSQLSSAGHFRCPCGPKDPHMAFSDPDPLLGGGTHASLGKPPKPGGLCVAPAVARGSASDQAAGPGPR